MFISKEKLIKKVKKVDILVINYAIIIKKRKVKYINISSL